MTLEEFSNEFDILYNNITSNQAPPLDEYEKSVLLTQGQEYILKSYFSKANPMAQGFDDSPERQMDYSTLITTFSNESFGTDFLFDPRAIVSTLPDNIFLIIQEVVYTDTKDSKIVVPINYREYSRIMNKPYKQPFKNQAWRMFQNDTEGKLVAEIIPRATDVITKYVVRYIRRPVPIILNNLTDGLNINGINTTSECELDPIVHRDILDRAVMMAKIAYQTAQPKENK